MDEYSPLRFRELSVIEESLNAKDFEKAQHLLAQVGTQPDLQAGVAYLATRLLFLKGRLDAVSVVERMRELVGANPQFHEARALMEHCKQLLQLSGSNPPPSPTPPPGSLFPSEPPAPALSTSDTTPLYVSPLSDLPLDGLEETDEPPESWPVPGFVTSADTIDDQERPTFVPESRALESRPIEANDSPVPESLAPTEYPEPLVHPTEHRLPLASVSREIQVDTRESILPVPPSLPPPNLFDSKGPRVEGRYSIHDDERESAKPRPPMGSGRYRVTTPIIEELVPPSLYPKPKRDARAVDVPPAPRMSHRSTADQSAFPPPLSGEVLTNPTTSMPRVEHLDLDAMDEPTPFRVPRPSSIIPPSSQDPPSFHAWNDPEHLFTRGDASAARARFEQKALELLEPYPTAFEDFPEKVDEIVHLLSATPVVHCFAPFDRSLSSLPRIELAIRTLYHGSSSLPLASVRPLLGLYVGEVLRASHRGSWRGVPERPSTWAIEAGAHIWQPLRCIAQLLTDPPGQSLLSSVGNGLAKRGTVAWMTSASLAPPLTRPWHAPLTPQKQAELGHWVANSPWSICTDKLFDRPLDGSIDSLRGLDRLLDFLCDSPETPKPNEPWLLRTATLAGAYVGFVLTTNAHAQWLDRTSATEQGIALELPGGIIATPVANVIARAVSRKRSQLADYVRALLRRAL